LDVTSKQFLGITLSDIYGLIKPVESNIKESKIGPIQGKDITDIFEQTVKEIPQIHKDLSEVIGNGRLFIFIDDLDRCSIENVLTILQTLKVFLNAKNVIFILAADFKY
jgi:hypothetical protein